MVKRIVLLSDFYHPHINKPAVDIVLQFIKRFKPHTINVLGDVMKQNWNKRGF